MEVLVTEIQLGPGWKMQRQPKRARRQECYCCGAEFEKGDEVNVVESRTRDSHPVWKGYYVCDDCLETRHSSRTGRELGP